MLNKTKLISRHPRQLNKDWAQHIVNLHSDNIKVSDVNLISIDIGTTTRTRIEINHSGPDNLSRKWFIKTPSLNWKAKLITALPRLLDTEIRFYNELSHLMPVVQPKVLSAASHFLNGSTLVLTDLTEQDARLGNPDDTLSISQAYLVIEQIAALHAGFWNKSLTDRKFRWLAGPVRKLEDHLGTALAVPLMKLGLKKAGDKVPHHLHQQAIYYARNRRQAMHFLSQGTQTIIHHDCHPGNLFWKNAQPGLLDWQMVRIGEGISDIAYFLATSLKPNDRRAKEADMLKHYYNCLKNHGIESIDFEQMQHRYRAHLSYPFEAMLITLAVGDMMDLKTNLKLISRTVCAVDDNDAFAALPI